ncbi:MAG: hypothetical protein MUO40_05285 [Anaerolineaceae bacterium]|nr:hypothetical protein [Anaerolineaceae bacterium]
MDKETLVDQLKQKLDLQVYVDQALADETVLPLLFAIIETDRSAIKFLCEKVIRQLSQSHPELLYPYFERISSLMDSDNNFIKWGFILTLPNLLKVDVQNKWDVVSKHYLSFLGSDSLVTFGNAVSGVPKILAAHPQHEQEIVSKLLDIDQHTFLHKGMVSPECLNVAKGHIIDCFTRIVPTAQYEQPILAFVRANLDNSRKQVREKAKRFLKGKE